MSRTRLILGGSLVLAALLVVALAALDAPADARVLLLCAAGVQQPIDEIVEAYNATTEGPRAFVQYGGSGTLLSGLTVYPIGDLFLAADASYLDTAQEYGLIAERRAIATIRPVIAFARDNPKRIQGVNDLLRADVTFALASPNAASIGRATRNALQHAGRWEQVRANCKVFLPTVNDVTNTIALGSVDAGIIWDANARQQADLSYCSDPVLGQRTERVTVGVLRGSADTRAAHDLLRFLTQSQTARAAFARHGYVTTVESASDG